MRYSLSSLIAVSLLSPSALAEGPIAPIVTLSGFVDSSLSATFTPKELADQGLLIGLDQVELDVGVVMGGGLSLRADLEYFPARQLDPAAGAVATFDQIVEQGFAEWRPCDFFVRVGKWNAPVGFEVIDPTGLWQWSYGLLFTYATPANLTGLALGWAGATTQAQLWLTNGWDEPATAKAASLGGRLQQGLGDAGTIGLSATFGRLAEASPKLMVDVDLALSFDPLRIGLQLNFGRQDDYQSLGALLSLNYALSSASSMTLRGDYLDRDIPGSEYRGAAVTVAGLLNLTQGFDLIAEVRTDLPDGADAIVAGALELLAAF